MMAESHVLSALRQKRAAVLRDIQALERRLCEMRAALVHLEGAMRLFLEEDAAPEAPSPPVPATGGGLPAALPRGDMTRLVLDALRGSVDGQPLPRLTERVAVALGVAEDAKARDKLTERVRNALYRLRDREAVAVRREAGTVLWRTAEG